MVDLSIAIWLDLPEDHISVSWISVNELASGSSLIHLFQACGCMMRYMQEGKTPKRSEKKMAFEHELVTDEQSLVRVLRAVG